MSSGATPGAGEEHAGGPRQERGLGVTHSHLPRRLEFCPSEPRNVKKCEVMWGQKQRKVLSPGTGYLPPCTFWS